MNFFSQFPKVKYNFLNNGINHNITDFSRYAALNDINFDSISFYRYYEIQNGNRPDVVSRILYDTPDYFWTFFVINDHLKNWNGWPLSESAFTDYIKENYTGYAITLDIPLYEITDSLISDNEYTLIDSSSGNEYSCTLFSKDVNLNQIVVKNVTGGDITNKVDQIKLEDDSIHNLKKSSVTPFWNGVHHYETKDGEPIYNLSMYDSPPFEQQIFPVSYYEYEKKLNDEKSNIKVIKHDYIYSFKKIYMELINA